MIVSNKGVGLRSNKLSLLCILRAAFVFSILFLVGCVGIVYRFHQDFTFQSVATLIPPVYTQHSWAANSICRQHPQQHQNHTTTPKVCIAKSRHRACTTTTLHNATTVTSPPRIAVAVIAATRAEYFAQMMQSLERNDNTVKFDVHIFVDHVQGNEQVLRLAQQKASHILHTNFTSNQGVAKLTLLAMETVFRSYDQLILLEEDHVIAPNYIATLSQLLTISDTMDSIGVVAGNLLNYNNNNNTLLDKTTCRYQMAPLDGFSVLSSHNVWAWGMSRQKYTRMRSIYKDGLQTTGLLSSVPYNRRNTKTIARWMRHTCGSRYHHWQGQDWMRACALAAAGMPYKLQTIDRTLQYIGVQGLHTTTESFAAKRFPSEPPESTQRLEHMQEDMCEHLCYGDLVVPHSE